MKTKYSAMMIGSCLMLAGAGEAWAAKPTLLPLRYETNGVYIYNGVTRQTVETVFGTNLLGLAFTGTTTYDFYSPPLSMNISLVPSDKSGGVIYMQNNSTNRANDFSVTGRMQYFDYDPATRKQTLIVDTTASSRTNVKHGQTVNWAIPNALLPADTVISAGHMIHIAMTIGLVSGKPGIFGQVLYNGANGASTVALFPQNHSIGLVWPISSGPMVPPAILSIGVSPDPAAQISCSGTPGGTYLIQATTNLGNAAAWTSISTNLAGTNGLFTFIDSHAADYPSRYYRASTP